MSTQSDRYLVACAYCVALLDFISALLFAIISGLVFHKHRNGSALLALLFTIFWVVIIIILGAGIYGRKLKLVRFWLVFTCVGIILDGIILLYGLTMAIGVNWDGVKLTVLPFAGLAVEMTFVYIIYLFYPYLEEEEPSCPSSPQADDDCCRMNAGFTMEDEVEEKVEEKVDEKPLDRKELKRLQKSSRERLKKEKAALKELKKQMRSKS